MSQVGAQFLKPYMICANKTGLDSEEEDSQRQVHLQAVRWGLWTFCANITQSPSQKRELAKTHIAISLTRIDSVGLTGRPQPIFFCFPHTVPIETVQGLS